VVAGLGGDAGSGRLILLGLPIPSPAIMEKKGLHFRKAVTQFASGHDIPVVTFTNEDRKQDVAAPFIDRLAKAGTPGVAMIGVAQEFASVMPPETIRTLPLGFGVILLRTTRPIITDLRPWTARPDATQLQADRRQLESILQSG
jgi:hypothetical protein